MSTDRIAIMGGGLAGLALAYRLQRAGLDFDLFEARNRLGGRILTLGDSESVAADGFDLGPSWFWPGQSRALDRLIAELGVPAFPQHSHGDVLVERHAGQPVRYAGMRHEPHSMRLAGGTATLINALVSRIPAKAVKLGQRVREIRLAARCLDVTIADEADMAARHSYARLIIAAPPRLAEATLRFEPGLAPHIAGLWRRTPTWMAPHAKFFALYHRPFWREAGLSGTGQSALGPLIEIHDATTASGKAALFGFVGLPADQRRGVSREILAAACVDQLARMFGADAAAPYATLFKDWAADNLTATAADIGGDHPTPYPGAWVDDDWKGRVWLAGSETSLADPGYLAGAAEAAERTATAVISATLKNSSICNAERRP